VHGLGDLIAIGSHDDLICYGEVDDALPDADYQGCSTNEAKRFSREA
jgi:hypothetical protein